MNRGRPASAGMDVFSTKTRKVPVLALSPDEAAQALGCSRDFFDEHIAIELRIVRRGRRKLVAVAELERWLTVSAALLGTLDR